MSKWSGGLVNYRLWMYASITHLCRCLSSYRQLAVASKKTHDLPQFQLYLSVWVVLLHVTTVNNFNFSDH